MIFEYIATAFNAEDCSPNFKLYSGIQFVNIFIKSYILTRLSKIKINTANRLTIENGLHKVSRQPYAICVTLPFHNAYYGRLVCINVDAPYPYPSGVKPNYVIKDIVPVNNANELFVFLVSRQFFRFLKKTKQIKALINTVNTDFFGKQSMLKYRELINKYGIIDATMTEEIQNLAIDLPRKIVTNTLVKILTR